MANEITRILNAARDGDAEAAESLYGRLYGELRLLARRQLRRLRGGPLQTTEVVHEAYMRISKQVELGVDDRAHFFALSAKAMRQVLIDHFRGLQAQKRGGDRRPVTLDEGRLPVDDRGVRLLELDDALQALALLSPRLERVVELKFFGGMTEKEIGVALEVSERTVRGDWRKARAWLARELTEA